MQCFLFITSFDVLIICVFTFLIIHVFLFQALLHASVACRKKLVVDWIAAGDLEENSQKEVCWLIS